MSCLELYKLCFNTRPMTWVSKHTVCWSEPVLPHCNTGFRLDTSNSLKILVSRCLCHCQERSRLHLLLYDVHTNISILISVFSCWFFLITCPVMSNLSHGQNYSNQVRCSLHAQKQSYRKSWRWLFTDFFFQCYYYLISYFAPLILQPYTAVRASLQEKMRMSKSAWAKKRWD